MEVQSTFQMKLEGIFTRQNSYQNPHSLQENEIQHGHSKIYDKSVFTFKTTEIKFLLPF